MIPWKQGNPGCPCCDDDEPDPPCAIEVVVGVKGCQIGVQPQVNIQGVTVWIAYGEDVLDSEVTDASGAVTLDITLPSLPVSMTLNWGAHCGYAAGSTPIGFSDCSDRYFVIQLEADEEHVCICSTRYPVPRTLYFTCDSGVVTMEWSEVFGAWLGDLLFTGRGADEADFDERYFCDCPPGPGAPGTDVDEPKFTYSTKEISFSVTYNCSSIGVTWGGWVGQTDCEECDWAYWNTGPAADLPLGIIASASGSKAGQAIDLEAALDCDGFSASGTISGDLEICIGLINCGDPMSPEEYDYTCCSSVPNPIGNWTLTS